MKAPKKNNSEITFQIVDIELVEFCIQDKKEHIKDFESNDLGDFVFEISLGQEADFDKNIIAARTLLVIKNNEKSFEYASLTTKCYYRFNDLSVFLDNKKVLNIPDNYRDRISSISISTSRGILFSQLNPTYLKKLVLPIVDVAAFTYNRPT